MPQQSSRVRRRLLWVLAVTFGICLIGVIGLYLAKYPRRALVSDVRNAEKVVIKWTLPEGQRGYRDIAFELDGPTKPEVLAELNENLDVDYFRAQATVTPTIGIYLFNSKGELVACYGIRYARGVGRCPSMESIRKTATKGRRLSDIEADSLFNDRHLQAKWPGILPGRYDFVLPVTGVETDKDPLWEERRIVPEDTDPAIRYNLIGHTKPVLAIAYSPDGRTIASGSWDKTVKLWDAATGKNITTLNGHTAEIRSVAFSPDGKTLASAGGNDQTVKLWDVASGKNTATLKGHDGIVSSVAYSPDGKTMASGSWDGTVKLWDMATGKSIATFRGHTDFRGDIDGIRSVIFSPDGRTIASGSADKTVRIWDVPTDKCVGTLTGHTAYVSSVAFSPDGKVVASGSADDTIKLWGVATSTCSATLKFPALAAYGDVSVAFSPDGKTLASAGLGRKITLWDLSSGKRTIIFSGYSTDADRLAFSPDGKLLVSCSDNDDNTIKVWDMNIIQSKQPRQSDSLPAKP